jgi:hypothetical protein
VKYLVETWGNDLLPMAARDGATCLWLACDREHMDVAKYLIDVDGLF